MLTSTARSCKLLHSQLPRCSAICPAYARARHSIRQYQRHIATRPRPAAAAAMAGEGAPVGQEAFFGPGSQELRSQSCGGACSRDTPKLTDAELDEALRALPAWRPAPDRASITRAFVAKNFVKAIEFFGRVAEVAEAEGHHPDLHLTNFRDVSITVSTHAVGGLTRPDVILAAKLDAVPVEYSPKWLRENAPSA